MSAVSQEPTAPPGFGRWMGTLWGFTLARFGLFFVLWGVLFLIGLDPLLGAMVALVLSVPLSFVLLRRPRQAVAAQIEARVDARRRERDDLDSQLDPEGHDRDD